MERKYYLRGVGIGIVVTAIIMGIALSGNKSMTDKEIIARAKELGMIEDTVLSDTAEDEPGSEGETAGNTVSPEEQDKIDRILADADSAGMEQDKSSVQDNASGTDNSAAGDIVTGNPEADKPDTANDSQGVDAESEAGEDSKEGTPDKKDTAENNKDKADAAGDKEDENDNEAIVSSAVKTITVVSGDGSYSVAKKLENAGIITSASNYDAYLCEHGYDKKLQTGTFSIPADASDEQIARIVTRTE